MVCRKPPSWKALILGLLTLLLAACAAPQQPAIVTEQPIPAAPTAIQGVQPSLPLIGEVEFVTIEPQGPRLAARIDTGATTSSIDARNIKSFERDGEKWVSFELLDPRTQQSQQLKRPLERIVSIKRHGAPDQERPVVTLQVSMGPIQQKSEFSLTDRSKFEYPVLIGRSFLSGAAIVDVSKKYALSPLGEN